MNEKPPGDQRQRIDKWLFFTRIVKSRALAQDLVEAGFVQVNGQIVQQSSRMVRIGDVIELKLERGDRVLIVRAPGDRRGPFAEAQTLYDDRTPQQAPLSPFERAQRKLGPG
ncbi:RNA-binding S4 domain-containing protein [Rhizobium straminoryzae]|uniref:RNA-binding S4 domain-containing protein n=1 Tax=Rhizobium straminoryzae TaxID=1387186 RepID=A0A549T5A9_9HYPH|nr:RNA-binding S4 domain-containing protein [Rhizobium straminoryzae]TRL37032.1 RNA-binding S4 domain-containing protein [Rhizobium straminoryzae]